MAAGTGEGGRPTIALLASRSMRSGPLSPLLRLARAVEPWWRDVLRPRLVLASGSHKTLAQYGVLEGYEHLEVLPPGRAGGLVTLASRLVDPSPEAAVDWVIYLMDPSDPTSLYPESQAVKRECVVNAKPFLATEAAALEWCLIHWLAADRTAPHPATQRFLRPRRPGEPTFGTGLALIAHDAHKNDMVRFAADYAGLLGRFPSRMATGTTGGLLNGAIPRRLAEQGEATGREAETYRRFGFLPAAVARKLDEYEELQHLTDRLAGTLRAARAPEPWVAAMRSGPQGGDVQIAQAVLDGACKHIIFFEDPLVSREHEADIMLLERAARIRTAEAVCMHDPATARNWAEAWSTCLEHPDLAPVSLEMAFRRRFGCELIVAHQGPRETMRRYASGLTAADGSAAQVAFAGEPVPQGGVAVLTAEEAAAALDAVGRGEETTTA